MQGFIRHRQQDDWIGQVFSAKAAQRGAVVRRSVAWVEREVGRDAFIAEVRRRGYHMLECAGQFVIICNADEIRVVCGIFGENSDSIFRRKIASLLRRMRRLL